MDNDRRGLRGARGRIYKSLITLQQTADNHGADKRQQNGSAAIFVAGAKLIIFSFFFFGKKKEEKSLSK